MVDSFGPDVVLTDVRMPKMGGLDLLTTLKAKGNEATVIVMSAYGNMDLALEAMKAGAYDYVQKPFKPTKSCSRYARPKSESCCGAKIARCATKSAKSIASTTSWPRVRRCSTSSVPSPKSPSTRRPCWWRARAASQRVGRARHPPPQHAPRGLVRRRQLRSDPRKSAGERAIRPQERRLHRRRARPARVIRRSRWRLTVLDEIGELPLALQVKLLRVLEEEKIRRVGDVRDIKIDVRIITATHRDLLAETKAGRFREDLFYRLNVLPILVPPLRDRREDIPLLIDHFVARNNVRLGTSIRGLDTESRRLLFEYPWPATCASWRTPSNGPWCWRRGDQIVAQDLPDRLREAKDPVQMQLASGELSVKKTMRIVEEILIRRALQRTKGNRTRAAEVLEISHRALLYKIKDYQITDL